MKCHRKNCDRAVAVSGLCATHYELIPHGYVDARPSVIRYRELRAVGLSCQKIALLTGLHRDTLRLMGRWTENRQVTMDTHQRIMAVTVPKGLVDGGGKVDATGTRRRLQALMLAGFRQPDIGAQFGVTPQSVASWMSRPMVTARTAYRVAQLFEKWQLLQGGSEATTARARKAGWVPALAWDDIDDPYETPKHNLKSVVSFEERYRELRDCGYTRDDIARRWGIQVESLERQLYRLKVAA